MRSDSELAALLSGSPLSHGRASGTTRANVVAARPNRPDPPETKRRDRPRRPRRDCVAPARPEPRVCDPIPNSLRCFRAPRCRTAARRGRRGPTSSLRVRTDPTRLRRSAGIGLGGRDAIQRALAVGMMSSRRSSLFPKRVTEGGHGGPLRLALRAGGHGVPLLTRRAGRHGVPLLTRRAGRRGVPLLTRRAGRHGGPLRLALRAGRHGVFGVTGLTCEPQR